MNTKKYVRNQIIWTLYNKNCIGDIKYSYSYFTFRFRLASKSQQEELCKFLSKYDENEPMPWELCNFFLNRDMKFSVRFRFVQKAKLKDNWKMFLYVLCLNKNKIRIELIKFWSNYIIVPVIKKENIGGRERWIFSLQLLNRKKKIIYFVTMNRNVWWKPKKIIQKLKNGSIVSVGYLFTQIGKYNIE